MSVHYSDQRALSSAQAKREVLQLFFDLAARHPGARAALQETGTLVQPGAFTWEDLAHLHHQSNQPPPAPSPFASHPPLAEQPASGSVVVVQSHDKAERKTKRAKGKKDKKSKKDKTARGCEEHPQADTGKRHKAHR